ncbi:MAG: triose-phosphate isomerase [Elusimicrobia bacterium]|nr:triose-phosphate isomerase [Elusimicrobiota bacterium]
MSSPLRKPLIAGNWKMHLTLAQSLELARAVRDGVGDAASEVALCVPFTAPALVAETLRGSRVRLGAQDLHWETQGASPGKSLRSSWSTRERR